MLCLSFLSCHVFLEIKYYLLFVQFSDSFLCDLSLVSFTACTHIFVFHLQSVVPIALFVLIYMNIIHL